MRLFQGRPRPALMIRVLHTGMSPCLYSNHLNRPVASSALNSSSILSLHTFVREIEKLEVAIHRSSHSHPVIKEMEQVRSTWIHNCGIKDQSAVHVLHRAALCLFRVVSRNWCLCILRNRSSENVLCGCSSRRQVSHHRLHLPIFFCNAKLGVDFRRQCNLDARFPFKPTQLLPEQHRQYLGMLKASAYPNYFLGLGLWARHWMWFS